MIKKVILKNFKRFRDQEFELDDAIVLAGPNNSGKTTLIQAIATWHFALDKWRIDKGGSKAKKRTGAAITRQEFRTMPVRGLNLLWSGTSTALKSSEGRAGASRVMSITLQGGSGEPWELTMEFRYSNPELVYARPSAGTIPDGLSEIIVHIPSFSGISAEEPIHAPEYQGWLIGQGKPGDILRNLLVDVYREKNQWKSLNNAVEEIFHCHLLPPQYEGRPFILCDYLPGIPAKKGGHGGLPRLDIANGGSGFLQTLTLLAFFYARPATIILMDEPDAHLHVILQGQIYDRLRGLARDNGSQLIMATHSEVLIDRTAPDRIISFYGSPHILVKDTERDAVREALKRLSSMDVALSEKGQVLYVEGESDFEMLRAWAEVLEHPSRTWFSGKEAYYHLMRGRNPAEARAHFFALRALKSDMKGVILLDADDKGELGRGANRSGLKIRKWRRYEIENYLIHPDSIRRVVEKFAGPLFGDQAMEAMKEALPRAVMNNPLDDHDYLERTPASKELLPSFLTGTGVRKKEYYQIAARMKPEEIHSDIKGMLDEIAGHFGLLK